MVLKCLREAGLQCDIKINLAKIEAIIGWEKPENVHDVQLFLEFANFYQQFIKHFLKIV